MFDFISRDLNRKKYKHIRSLYSSINTRTRSRAVIEPSIECSNSIHLILFRT
jgi:hypothetical protein